MANKAWLTKRVKIDGKWMKRSPVVGANGVLTDKVQHNGTTLHAPGIFGLEWHENGKRMYRPLTEESDDFGLAHEINVQARELPLTNYSFRLSTEGLMRLKLLGKKVLNYDYYFQPLRRA